MMRPTLNTFTIAKPTIMKVMVVDGGAWLAAGAKARTSGKKGGDV